MSTSTEWRRNQADRARILLWMCSWSSWQEVTVQGRIAQRKCEPLSLLQGVWEFMPGERTTCLSCGMSIAVPCCELPGNRSSRCCAALRKQPKNTQRLGKERLPQVSRQVSSASKFILNCPASICSEPGVCFSSQLTDALFVALVAKVSVQKQFTSLPFCLR